MIFSFRHSFIARAVWPIVLAACALVSPAWAGDSAPVRTAKLGGYVVGVERTVGGEAVMAEDLLTIRKDGRLYYAETDAHIQFTTPKESLAELPALVAVTGKAARDIVVQSFSGGAHCCSTVTIITLSDPFAASVPLDTESAGASLFELPGGGHGIETAESVFNYWRTSYVDSPEPELFLRYDAASGYKFVRGMMRKPTPPPAALDKLAKQLRGDAKAWTVGPDLVSPPYLRAVVDLIYGGNIEAARKLAATGWPDSRPGRDAFVQDLFSCQLPKSRWWRDVAALNGIQPYDRAADCN